MAAEVNKEEVTSTNKGEEDNIMGVGRMEGNTRLAQGFRLTTSNIKTGCMRLNSIMASKEEANRFQDQKRTQKTLTHHMKLLQ